jgi:hypothetical protein
MEFAGDMLNVEKGSSLPEVEVMLKSQDPTVSTCKFETRRPAMLRELLRVST